MSEHAHVIALLGKSHPHQSSEISREFARRLEAYVDIISAASPDDLHVAICGYREAEPAMEWLLRKHAHRLPPPTQRFVDNVSRTSIQNFEALGRYLASSVLPPCPGARLTIVSSDYHVARLRFVDEHLPAQSLVRSVAPAVAPPSLGWESVDLSPPPDAADAIRWCSRVHTTAEQMMPLQINIEGVLQLRLKRIVDAAYAQFKSSLSELAEALDSPPEQIRAGFRPTLQAATEAVRSIAELPDRLAPYLTIMDGPTRELDSILFVLRDALRKLRTANDLDGPEFDRLYHAES